jgi:hypothetical protein
MTDGRLKIVNASGFLFQSRVEHEVDSTTQRHGWKVLVREYAWRDQKGAEHYADMILGNGEMFFVVECKRTQQADWVFLVEEQITQTRVRCHWANEAMAGWYDFDAHPLSHESDYCSIRGSGEDHVTLLDRLAGPLTTAAEKIAIDQVHGGGQGVWYFFPVIVTNARLSVCRYSAEKVSLADGKLADAEIEEVPVVRYRKALTTRVWTEKRPLSLRRTNEDRQRTVLVVNAAGLVDLLSNWDLTVGVPPWELAEYKVRKAHA